MKILIINGNDTDDRLDHFINTFEESLVDLNNEIISYRLNDLTIEQCIGCEDCAYKTPGICKFKDDMAEILHEILGVDRVIIIYSLRRGFMNTVTKGFIDRFYPLELPYLNIKNGYFTHKLRYDYYPKFGFIVKTEDDTDEEELDIQSRINEHIGSLYGGFLYQKTTEESLEEILNETISI